MKNTFSEKLLSIIALIFIAVLQIYLYKVSKHSRLYLSNHKDTIAKIIDVNEQRVVYEFYNESQGSVIKNFKSSDGYSILLNMSVGDSISMSYSEANPQYVIFAGENEPSLFLYAFFLLLTLCLQLGFILVFFDKIPADTFL